MHPAACASSKSSKHGGRATHVRSSLGHTGSSVRSPSLLNISLMAICQDTFSAQMPNIQPSRWASIVSRSSDTVAETERLEFIGDAILYLCVGLDIYDRYPLANPGLMTEVRQILVMNIVLAVIAEKIDPRVTRNGSLLQRISHLVELRRDRQRASTTVSRGAYKPAADCLESAVAALYMEKGFTAARAWIGCTFAPLIDECMRTRDERDRELAQRSSIHRKLPAADLGVRLPGKAHHISFDACDTPPVKVHARSSKNNGPTDQDIVIDLTLDDSDAENAAEESAEGDDEDEDDGPSVIDLTNDSDEEFVFKQAVPSMEARIQSRSTFPEGSIFNQSQPQFVVHHIYDVDEGEGIPMRIAAPAVSSAPETPLRSIRPSIRLGKASQDAISSDDAEDADTVGTENDASSDMCCESD